MINNPLVVGMEPLQVRCNCKRKIAIICVASICDALFKALTNKNGSSGENLG